MTPTAPADAAPRAGASARARFDRTVLVANLAASAFGLLVAAVVATPVLSLFGLVYVVPASLFLAAFYARPDYSMRQEALAWAAPLLYAGVLWGGVLFAAELGDDAAGSPSEWLLVWVSGLVTAGLLHVAWQLLALAVRQPMARRAGPATSRP